MAEKIKAAAYIRISVAGQSSSLEAQRNVIDEYCANHNLEPTYFIDESTGKNLDREGMEQMKKALFNGEYSTVIVYKLDRLSRSLVDGLNLLSDFLNKDVRVISITQQFDFTGSVGKMIAAVLMAVSEMEVEQRRESQLIGIANRKAKGGYLGRKKGSTKIKEMSKALRLKQKGLSMSEVAKTLGVSLRTAVRYKDQHCCDMTIGLFGKVVIQIAKALNQKAFLFNKYDNKKFPKYPKLGFAFGEDATEEDLTFLSESFVEFFVKKYETDSLAHVEANTTYLFSYIRALMEDDKPLIAWYNGDIDDSKYRRSAPDSPSYRFLAEKQSYLLGYWTELLFKRSETDDDDEFSKLLNKANPPFGIEISIDDMDDEVAMWQKLTIQELDNNSIIKKDWNKTVADKQDTEEVAKVEEELKKEKSGDEPDDFHLEMISPD
jgi:DNA invertase Pin-like site-specific DNA recombinase